VNNLCCLRAEERIALSVLLPQGLITGTPGDDKREEIRSTPVRAGYALDCVNHFYGTTDGGTCWLSQWSRNRWFALRHVCRSFSGVPVASDAHLTPPRVLPTVLLYSLTALRYTASNLTHSLQSTPES